jgi:microcystin-dependent protein
MARETTFTPGVVVSSTFLNDRQDLESALTFIRVELASTTSIRVPVVADGSPAGQTPAIINGQPRLNGTPYVMGLSSGTQGSSATTFDVYATLAGAVITDGFTLQLVGRTGGSPYGGTPGAAPANSRKVAELDWTGAVINALRNTVEVAGHAGNHAYGLPSGYGDPLAAKSIDVSQLMASVTNKQAFVGDLKLSLATSDHGPRGDGTFEWVLVSPGRTLPAATYPALYAAMGSPALTGGNFSLPAINDRALVAAGSTYPAGNAPGAPTVTLAPLNIPRHYHGWSGSNTFGTGGESGHTHGAPAGYGNFVVALNNANPMTGKLLASGANYGWDYSSPTVGGSGHTHAVGVSLGGNTDYGTSPDTGQALPAGPNAISVVQPSYALAVFVKT